MGRYTIKEVETLSGLKAHTLRIWEQRYNFIQPSRTETNIRYYTDDQLKYILNIAYLNQKGFKISKLSQLSDEEIAAEIEKFHNSTSPYDYYIHGLQSSMIEFDKVKFEKTISNCLLREGMLKTILHVIVPFLERIGIMWTTGIINPAQEHFVTNMIRKKIIVAIDGIQVSPTPHSKKFILFLNEGELHEIPLLIAQYILKSQGHDVLYMGASLPLKDLKNAVEYIKPHYLLSVVTVPIPEFTVKEYFSIITSSFKSLTCLICGSQTKNVSSSQEHRITVVPSFQALVDLSTSL